MEQVGVCKWEALEHSSAQPGKDVGMFMWGWQKGDFAWRRGGVGLWLKQDGPVVFEGGWERCMAQEMNLKWKGVVITWQKGRDV